jgi:hypothetical protein
MFRLLVVMKKIREYIQDQEKEDRKLEQGDLFR